MASITRFRAIPWLALIDVARTTKAHIDRHLSTADRRRVAALASKSKGDVRKLSEREKADLKRIARDLNLAMLMRDLAPAASRLRRRRPGP